MREGLQRAVIAVGAVALISASACSADEPEEAVPASPTIEAESDDAEPTPSPVAESAEVDVWVEHMWHTHLEDLTDWWNDHYHSGCDLTEAECVEHFAGAHEMMHSFAEAMRNSNIERPSFVPSFYGSEVNIASRRMKSYYHACLDRDQCTPGADGLEYEVYELMVEADSWWDQ